VFIYNLINTRTHTGRNRVCAMVSHIPSKFTTNFIRTSIKIILIRRMIDIYSNQFNFLQYFALWLHAHTEVYQDTSTDLICLS
jgi:hypothetical protein